MAKATLHVVPHEDGWAVKREGNERNSSTHDTQKDAIEAARSLAKEGDDIVIHRPDGAIRETTTYMPRDDSKENEGDDRVAVRESRPQLYDRVSVGSRVSWAAILAGVVTAIAANALLMSLAVAMGVTTLDRISAGSFNTVAAWVALVILLVSLFLGGFAAARMTARETRSEAIVHGALVWGTLFTLLSLGLGAGMGVSQSRTANRPAADTNFWQRLDWTPEQTRRYTELTSPDRVRKELGLNEEQARHYEQAKGDAHGRGDGLSAEMLAWLTFAGILGSLAAALGGGLAGSGPELRLVRRRGDDRADTKLR